MPGAAAASLSAFLRDSAEPLNSVSSAEPAKHDEQSPEHAPRHSKKKRSSDLVDAMYIYQEHIDETFWVRHRASAESAQPLLLMNGYAASTTEYSLRVELRSLSSLEFSSRRPCKRATGFQMQLSQQ